jgi:ribosome-associated heat shock protein Hsp15
MTDKVRIDKWLWSVRIFKTRSLASEACNKGRVIIDQEHVKPSRIVKLGDLVTVRKPPVIYSYRVTGLIKSRVSAPLAALNYEDITSVDELNKLLINDTIFVHREKGTGRPTKKERREIDRFVDDLESV